MDYHFIDINGFDGMYEISIESPHIVRYKPTGYVIDEWYNDRGDIAVVLNGELYLITELIPN